MASSSVRRELSEGVPKLRGGSQMCGDVLDGHFLEEEDDAVA